MKLPWGRCNLCGWPIVRIGSSVFGTRCPRCLSTQIHRAVGLAIDAFAFDDTIRVYELSSAGALFRYLKRRFRRFSFSEYFDNVPPGEMRDGVPCQDVQYLTHPDESFDLVTSTEVFEHVPDDMKGFCEVCRVLKKGGYFIFTVPLSRNATTLERALLRPDGRIEHLEEPEYHSDRLRGAGKVLAFRTYGKDLVARLESAGFVAETRYMASSRHSVFGIPVHIARKPLD